MSLYIHIFNESPVQLWGLTNAQRIRRELAQYLRKNRITGLESGADIEFVENLEGIPAGGILVLFRGDYVYDVRVMANLIDAPDTLLRVDAGDTSEIVAGRVTPEMGARVKAHIQGDDAELPPGLKTETPETLVPPSQIRLKKAQAAFVLPVNRDNARQLEHHLFKNAYKGVTDLVTKWVWPVPARWVTRLCVRFGLRPNHVTAVSWVLAVLAGILFYQGDLAAGLVMGWIMTFLDTVDGKLARVTVTSSPVGNYLDHVLDLLHPPIWYMAWGLGLASFAPVLLPADLTLTIVMIFVGYIAGRLVEGAFSQWLGSFGIYSWRRIDSFTRLITARRNPCLIFMTIGWLAGHPDLALEAVAVWTLVSSLFLIIRLVMAVQTRYTRGPLYSWLIEIGRHGEDRSLAARWFRH
jgi:phosphatidylglycerophosphate synthase